MESALPSSNFAPKLPCTPEYPASSSDNTSVVPEFGILHEDLIDIISGAAEKAYTDFARANPSILAANPWELPYCFEIAPLLQAHLEEQDIETRVIHGGGGQADDIHDYLQTSGGLVIDPTWQQHLNPAARSALDLPRILVVQRRELRQVLSECHIPDAVQDRWEVQ